MVKKRIYIPLLSCLLFLLTACPSQNTSQNDLKKFQENNMDFPDLEWMYYEGIEFQLSNLFEKDYSQNYTVHPDAMAKVIYNMDLNFSVEVFDEYDVNQISFASDNDKELTNLEIVHNDFILKRQESLYDYSTSIRKRVPKTVGFDGFIQTVHGSTYSSDDGSSYFTATLEINNKYYVFQLIGLKANMGYLYDDFIDLLSSVQV